MCVCVCVNVHIVSVIVKLPVGPVWYMGAIKIRFIVIISSIMDWCFGRLLEIAA